MLKIMTLNLWRYYEWGERKNNITSLIENEKPDIIALQEVQTNLSFSSMPQSDYLADEINYKYRVFSPTSEKVNQINKVGNMESRASHGLAIISTYPIISSESYFLKRQSTDKETRSVLFCKIETNQGVVDVCNVHFSNNDKFADFQLKELIDLCKEKDLKPVILGDFNLFSLDQYKNNYLMGYTVSTDIEKYMSYPKDNGTLDYIISPNAYMIKKIFCSNSYVSDHRAVLAKIDLSYSSTIR